MPVRCPWILLLALAMSLLAAVPAAADGLVQLDGSVLRFTGDERRAQQRHDSTTGTACSCSRRTGSRMTAGAGCTASTDGYEVTCPDLGVAQIDVERRAARQDVRIRADLPAHTLGGPRSAT